MGFLLARASYVELHVGMIAARRASHGWTARRRLIPVRQAAHPSGQNSLRVNQDMG